jgi:hypothetical protein
MTVSEDFTSVTVEPGVPELAELLGLDDGEVIIAVELGRHRSMTNNAPCTYDDSARPVDQHARIPSRREGLPYQQIP